MFIACGKIDGKVVYFASPNGQNWLQTTGRLRKQDKKKFLDRLNGKTGTLPMTLSLGILKSLVDDFTIL